MTVESPRWKVPWQNVGRGRAGRPRGPYHNFPPAPEVGKGSRVECTWQGVTYEAVVLQMGKVGKDCFNMDYTFPFSMLQAFAVCLARFDTGVPLATTR